MGEGGGGKWRAIVTGKRLVYLIEMSEYMQVKQLIAVASETGTPTFILRLNKRVHTTNEISATWPFTGAVAHISF